APGGGFRGAAASRPRDQSPHAALQPGGPHRHAPARAAVARRRSDGIHARVAGAERRARSGAAGAARGSHRAAAPGAASRGRRRAAGARSGPGGGAEQPDPWAAPAAHRLNMRLACRSGRLGTENAFTVLAEVLRLEREGRDVINLGIGDPDFDTPENVKQAAVAALRANHTHYSPSAGILP